MAVKFKKKLIPEVSYEAASVFDVNNDGKHYSPYTVDNFAPSALVSDLKLVLNV